MSSDHDDDLEKVKANYLAEHYRSFNAAMQEYQESAQRRADAQNELAQMIKDAPDLDALADQLWDRVLHRE